MTAVDCSNAARSMSDAPEFTGSFEIGISNSVVMPPAAAALVPDRKSSRSATPG